MIAIVHALSQRPWPAEQKGDRRQLLSVDPKLPQVKGTLQFQVRFEIYLPLQFFFFGQPRNASDPIQSTKNTPAKQNRSIGAR